MTNTEVETILTDLKNVEDSTKLLQSLQSLNTLLQNAECTPFEKDLHIVLISYLEHTDKEVQIHVLNILCSCIKQDLFHGSDYVHVAYLVVNIINVCETDNVDQQEVFIKAVTCLQDMKYFHDILYKTRASEMIHILRKILNSSVSSVNKIQVFKMLENFIKYTDPKNESVFLLFWVENVCPIMFNSNQINLLNPTLEYSETLLPVLQNVFQKDVQQLNNFIATIENTYLPIMANLVSKDQLIFSQLWMFLSKLLSIKFHQGFQMVNMMLTVVESAFKSPNVDMRSQAFICWQNLIENFFINPDVVFNEKRVKLLTLPLKANNGKTEGLVEIKFNTWCKLFNVLNKRKVDLCSFSVIDQFLQFSFGPFCEQSLISWTIHNSNNVSQGKKYPSIHLKSCTAFLQLFGLKKYISEELKSKLTYFEFEGPVVHFQNFNQTKLLIDAVGESCVMLSLLENMDRKELEMISNALWKSLFDSIDNLQDEELKQNCIEKLCSLILAITGVARKRSALLNYCLIPLFVIITSNDFEFFKNFKIVEILFVPLIQSVMKKDKVLLQQDVTSIFKMIFQYKQHHDHFLKFIQIVLERFSLSIKDNLVQEKVNILQNIWFLMLDEIILFLRKKYDNYDENLFCNTFCEFILWPVTSLNKNLSDETLATKWKELYFIFGNSTSENTQNKLAIVMLKKIDNIPNKDQFLDHISKIISFIIKEIISKDDVTELSEGICELFSIIKDYVSMDNLTNEIVDIYQQTFQKLIAASVVYPYFLETSILDNIICLITKHNRINLLDDLLKVVKPHYQNIKYKKKIDKFIQILKDSDIDQNIINEFNISQNTIEETETETTPKIKLRIKKSLLTRHCSSDSEIGRKRARKQKILPIKEFPDITSDKPAEERPEIVTLLGHDVDTMTPVKVKGSMMPKKLSKISETESKSPKLSNSDEIFVHTPYKFDSKKLTKTQKEKFSKRKDDIPALYQDLSQNTQEFSNSNSNFETPKTDLETKEETSATEESTEKRKGRKRKEKENQTEENSIKKTRRKSTDNLENTKQIPKKRGRQLRNSKNPINIDFENETLENLIKFVKDKKVIGEKSVLEQDEETPKTLKTLRSSLTLKEKSKKPDESNKPAPETIVKSPESTVKSSETLKKIEKKLNLDLDDTQKIRVNRELSRIKMNIKNTDEFYKYEKRKTRTSFQNLSLDSSESDGEKGKAKNSEFGKGEKLEKKRSPDSEGLKKRKKASKEDDDPDYIGPSLDSPKDGKMLKQIKVPVLYPLDLVKPGEHIFISSGPTTTDIIRGPEPTSPFKVLETVKSPPNTETCKQISFEPEMEQLDTINEVPQIMDLSSSPKIIIHSNEIITEAYKPNNSETMSLETQQNLESDEQNLECRKVLFDSETPQIPENNSPDMESNLPGSPVSVETPTRNKELLKNTLEISPIKNINPDLEIADALSPEPSIPCLDIPERIGINSPHPHKVYSRKKGRGAQMMDMVAVKPILSPKKKNIKENKSENFVLQHQTRTIKMMENVASAIPENGSSSNEEIKVEDILTFTRELPSPYASPGLSILKKRKLEEENTDSRICKRRRVNFRDPLVSQKFIERHAKNKMCSSLKHDIILQESRITRSKVDQESIDVEPTTIDQVTIIDETNKDDVKCTLFSLNDELIDMENVEENIENIQENVEIIENIVDVSEIPENLPENPEKSNEVSVIKNSESLFSDSFLPEIEENVFEKHLPEGKLEEIVDKIFQMAAEKPELQYFLTEKLLSIVPLQEEMFLEAVCKKFSWDFIMEYVLKNYRNECKNNKE